MDRTCVVINVEKGILESYALLLLSSIKEFGGQLATFDILCFQPRKNFKVSESTAKKIKLLGAEFISEDINKSHKFYALANKPKVCSWVENNTDYNHIIFFDTDTVVLSEPRELLSHSENLGIVPVYKKGIGISSSNDPNYSFWRKIYEYAGEKIEDRSPLMPTLVGERIFPYWNTAVISSRNSGTLFTQWKELVVKALDSFTIPSGSNYFVEEACFSVIAAAKQYTVKNLGYNYNFPIDPSFRKYGLYKNILLEDVVICHHLSELQLLVKLIYRNQEETSISEKGGWLTYKLKELRLLDSVPTQLKFRYNNMRRWFLEKLFYVPFKFEKKLL